MTDLINRPPHYTHGAIEPIDVIESWRLPFHLANVIKYIARHEHKGSKIDDLRKARWYLDRYLTLAQDEQFDLVSAEERELCQRHDAAFARVDGVMRTGLLGDDGKEMP